MAGGVVDPVVRRLATWPTTSDASLAAAAALGPLLAATAFADTPAPTVPLDVFARIVAALALFHLLRELDVPAPAAWCAAALYAALGLRAHAQAGAAIALLLLAVARARDNRAAALACAAVGTALAIGGDDVQAGTLALAAVAPWALWRLTAVAGGWDGRAALPLGTGLAVGGLATLPLWWGARAMAPPALPEPSTLLVIAALAVAAIAGVGSSRHRALRGVLTLWALLFAGRAAGVPLASFLVDIAAPMPDAAFLDRALPALVLAALIAAALAWREAVWRRTIVVGVAAAAVAAVVAPRPGMLALDEVADGAAPHTQPLALEPGQSVSGVVPGERVPDGSVRRFGIEIGTYIGASDGQLALDLCAGARCATGTAPLAGAADNAVLSAPLAVPLATPAGMALRWRATHVGGHGPVAIWLAPASAGRTLEGPDGSIAEMAAHVALGYAHVDRAPPPRAP